MAIAGDEMPFCADNLRFFAGAARTLEGKAAGEYVEGYTSITRREPLGIVGRDHSLELPADDGDLEDRPGPRRRQRPDPQAGRADAAHDAPLRRARAGVPASGRAPGDHRRRRPRRRGPRPPPRRSGSSRSPATSATGKADRRRTPPRATSSASISSSAARRRWSCSTTPIRRTVAEAIKIGGYWNSGQDCTASSRILVHERVYDDVLSETVKAIEAMKVADPAEGEDVDMGPVISREQQERVLGFLERAVDAKATRRHRRRGHRRQRLLRPADRSSRTWSRTPRSSRTRSSGRS